MAQSLKSAALGVVGGVTAMAVTNHAMAGRPSPLGKGLPERTDAFPDTTLSNLRAELNEAKDTISKLQGTISELRHALAVEKHASDTRHRACNRRAATARRRYEAELRKLYGQLPRPLSADQQRRFEYLVAEHAQEQAIDKAHTEALHTFIQTHTTDPRDEPSK